MRPMVVMIFFTFSDYWMTDKQLHYNVFFFSLSLGLVHFIIVALFVYSQLWLCVFCPFLILPLIRFKSGDKRHALEDSRKKEGAMLVSILVDWNKITGWSVTEGQCGDIIFSWPERKLWRWRTKLVMGTASKWCFLNLGNFEQSIN